MFVSYVLCFCVFVLLSFFREGNVCVCVCVCVCVFMRVLIKLGMHIMSLDVTPTIVLSLQTII
jgi:hypothetical protein